MEEEEGNFALWMSYILTGAGANLISWLLLPTSSVSLGASGAVFGLFTISVLVKVIMSNLGLFHNISWMICNLIELIPILLLLLSCNRCPGTVERFLRSLSLVNLLLTR